MEKNDDAAPAGREPPEGRARARPADRAAPDNLSIGHIRRTGDGNVMWDQFRRDSGSAYRSG